MSDRDQILGKIRAALGSGDGHHAPAKESGNGALRDIAAQAPLCMPEGGKTPEEQLERFRAASLDLKTDLRICANENAWAEALVHLKKTESWKRVASHDTRLCRRAIETLGLPVLWTQAGYDKRELEACDAGITECDALVAQTGSVLVTSLSAGGRALSVLPPHHVVLARRDQLVPDLTAALALVRQKYGARTPSMISFITGPSRTGDIERILVLGAHGPKKLTILLQ